VAGFQVSLPGRFWVSANNSSIEMTLDIYSHVAPGMQEAAAKRFDDVIIQQKDDINNLVTK
jgi:hypothetical protein